MSQLHKRFSVDQVKGFFVRYLNREFKISYLLEILGIKRRRFFVLLKSYKENPKEFSITPTRTNKHRRIDPLIEQNILKELVIDQKMIKNPEVPLKNYNYSYVKERLLEAHHQHVSLSTIITKAREHGFYFKKRIQKIHDREVLTHYTGELIQHDSSHHLWAPDQKNKWYLITSLDDYSRFIFYAALVVHETVWTHILALQTLVLKYGLPFSFYVDSHSIFRFVRGRDEIHNRHYLLTDDVDTQWKKVLKDLTVKPIYALSPQAKGKIERPYRWLQDHLVRSCVRQNVQTIGVANRLLGWEVHQYNYKRIHSTTGEIPYIRFQRALKEKLSLFREFKLTPPFESVRDIFCLRLDRFTDPYCKVSIHNCQFQVKDTLPRQAINIRIHPLSEHVSELRFWSKDKLLDVQRAKNSDIKLVHF